MSVRVPAGIVDRARVGALTLALALIAVVALSRANAAKPDLRGGWPLDGLLPVELTAGQVTTLLWLAVLVGAAAVALGLWTRPGPLRWSVAVGVGLISLVAAPMGSGDHLNYAAYGRILLQGGDPWVESPAAWGGGADPITSAVEEPWTTEPSVYGPFATLLHGAAAAVGGDRLRLVVLGWQVVVVLAWLGVRFGLRRIVPVHSHGRIDVLWTLNPLVVMVGLLGAHVDTIATSLVIAAALCLTRPGMGGVVSAGVASALAATTKFTYAVVIVAIIVTWVVPGLGPRASHTTERDATERDATEPDATALGASWTWPPPCTRRITVLTVSFLVTVAGLHTWTGPHVYDQVARARSSVSLASPWRLALNAARPEMSAATARSLIGALAAVLAVVVALILLRALRPATSTAPAAALVTTAGLAVAYSLSAPYTLPWYDLLAWAALPVVLPSALDGLLLTRLAIMGLAYSPGRVVGSTAAVDAITLGFRRSVAPWLQLVLWLTVLTVGWWGRAGRVGRSGSVTPVAPHGSPPRGS